METNTKAEILAVDDHSLILEGICRVVGKMPDAVVADAVTSGVEALRLIARRDYDLYILDVSIPDVSGFELIEHIRELNEDARIIVNTMHEEIWIVNRLVQCGVNAVILKSAVTSELATAVHRVLQGESYACPRFTAVCQKLRRSTATLHAKDVPTPRELDVLRGISRGLNTHEIAVELGISDNTVETFRKRLISKFGARNSVDMVLKAVSRGWLRLE